MEESASVSRDMMSESSDAGSRLDSHALGYRSSINSLKDLEGEINGSEFTLPPADREELLIRHNNTISFKKTEGDSSDSVFGETKQKIDS